MIEKTPDSATRRVWLDQKITNRDFNKHGNPATRVTLQNRRFETKFTTIARIAQVFRAI